MAVEASCLTRLVPLSFFVATLICGVAIGLLIMQIYMLLFAAEAEQTDSNL